MIDIIKSSLKHVYKSDSLYFLNPKNTEDGSFRYDRWSEVPLLTEYCWNHLAHVVPGKDAAPFQFHYGFFPYILTLIIISTYVVQITWRFASLNRLVNVLDYVIEGLEEALRDMMAFVIREENRPQSSQRTPGFVEKQRSADTDMTLFEIADTDMKIFETTDADMDMDFLKNRGYGQGADILRTCVSTDLC